jgi:hypothetical protein
MIQHPTSRLLREQKSMKTQNQTTLRGFTLRALQPTTLASALTLLAAVSTTSAAGDTVAAPAPSVPKGDAATARLKEQGHYASLMEAMQAARYAVETVQANTGTPQGGECYAGNPAHSLRCWFRPDGLELQAAGAKQWKLNLRLRGYGRATLETADVDKVSARQSRVELSRAQGALVEWYDNRAAGLEQGFTLQHAPHGDGPLRLILEAEGDLHPEPEIRNTAVRFVAADGETTLRYTGLKVWDAAQRELTAHLEVQGRQLALVVNDRDAAYPVTLDPLITSQEAKLRPKIAGDGAAGDSFGHSVSLSSDGNTALVGASGDDTAAGANAGSAYVFVRSGANWGLQAKLMAGDGTSQDLFGASVSVSSDGSTALVGAPHATYDYPRNGGAYVFVRNGTNWSQQAELTPTDAGADDHFGYSVSISGDGTTAVAGASHGATVTGNAYVFVRSGSSWSQQARLTGLGEGISYGFGSSVSLNGDGNTAVVGAEEAQVTVSSGPGEGCAYVFVRSGSNWSQQAKLTAADGVVGDQLGCSVSVSSDGNTALVGAVWDGSAYVFVRSVKKWSQQAKLSASDGPYGDSFGRSVSVNSDGNTALVGAVSERQYSPDKNGCAYVFVRSGSSWSQQIKLTASDGGGIDDRFGISVSLAGDGSTVLVGAGGDDTDAGSGAGSAYVYVRSGSSWSQQEKLTAGDGGGGDDRFGYSVSVSENGHTALVGAPWDDTEGGADAGSAYVFLRNGSSWSQQAKLTANDGAANDHFGVRASVSSDGNTALVGATGYDTAAGTNVGSAYVYVRSGSSWSQQARLTANDGAAEDSFGYPVSVSRDGNTALVGACGDDTAAGTNAGSAYVYVRSGSSWSQQAKLTASDGAAEDYFASSVSVSSDGNTALVGASNDDTAGGANAGSAYVFVRSGSSWSQQAKLTPTNAGADDHFGYSVSISGDGNTAVAGALYDDTAAGSAYVFVRSGSSWSQQAKLTASDGAANNYFGTSVSVSSDGNTVLVGATRGSKSPGGFEGCAYVFARNGSTWSQLDKLTAEDGAAGDLFGNSASLSGDGSTALVGADPYQGGSAYVFRLLALPDSYNRLVAEALGPGAVRLTYVGLPGTNYALDRTFDLTPAVVWVPQETNPAPPAGTLILTNTTDPTTNKFWRMRSVP